MSIVLWQTYKQDGLRDETGIQGAIDLAASSFAEIAVSVVL